MSKRKPVVAAKPLEVGFKKVYISGPMGTATNRPDLNFPAFAQAAAYLRALGFEVISPHENFGGRTNLPRSTYMRKDVKSVLQVEAVAVLPGWEESRGARLEVDMARQLDLPVVDAQNLDRIEFKKPGDESAVSVLYQADDAVGGDRQKSYGHPLDNHGTTAEFWTSFIKRRFPSIDFAWFQLTPEDVCWMNILQKASRDANRPKQDNLVDTCGYARNVQLIQEERVARARKGFTATQALDSIAAATRRKA